MNKAENKAQVDFSNIRDLQNIIKTNGISKLAMGVKSLRQRLSSIGTKIVESKKKLEEIKKSEAKVVEVKQTVVEPQEVKPQVSVSAEKPVAQADKKPVLDNKTIYQNRQNAQRQNFENRQGGYQNRQNYQGRTDGGYQNRQGGKFVATGERKFDNNYGDKKPGSFSNSRFQKTDKPMGTQGGFQRKPFGAQTGATGAPRLPKPTEGFASSTLAKPNNRVAPQKKKSHDKGDEKKALNKKSLLMRGYVSDEGSMDEDGVVRVHSKKYKEENVQAQKVVQKIEHAVITTDNLTVKILAETIGKSVPELMGKFLLLGMMVNINSNIEFESAELVASEFGITLEKKVEKSFEEKLADSFKEFEDKEEDLVRRPAVVCVMGHVDHGKTSLLDQIRKTNVVSGEAGGITQSIGAYTIQLNGENITFIDTPGHEAFTAMRARGAKLTDIAILIVAADDGVMPQTVESIKQIKNANVPMIVAISKIDKPGANIDNVKTQLAQYDVLPEEWGGDAIIVPIDAKHGTNIDKLLEMVLFVAEYQNLKANPNRKASGSIIEAKLDRGLGAVATVLVQNGTLKVGDYVVVGTCTGKIRALMNDKNERIKSAGPSIAVQIMGLSGVPNAGDELFVVDEKMSRQVALERQNQAKVDMIKSADLSIENMMNKIADSNFKDYNVIVRADVQGSVEALKQALIAIQNEEVKVRFVSGSVGAVTENDISLAQASNALVVAFNTKIDFKAKVLADKYKVEVKTSRIIYEVIDYITEKISKMVTPKYKEVVTGHAEIRATFKASKVGLIAGTYVLDGKISRNSKVRVYRGDKKIYEGEIATLQREKNEAKEVDAGFECGATFAGFTDFAVGDTFETYNLERIN